MRVFDMHISCLMSVTCTSTYVLHDCTVQGARRAIVWSDEEEEDVLAQQAQLEQAALGPRAQEPLALEQQEQPALEQQEPAAEQEGLEGLEGLEGPQEPQEPQEPQVRSVFDG